MPIKPKPLVILVLCICLQIVLPSLSRAESPVEVKTELGLGGVQYTGKWLPLSIKITNKTNQFLQGRIMVSAEYIDRCSQQSIPLRSYTADYELPAWEKNRTVLLPIRLSQNTDLINVYIFNHDQLIHTEKITHTALHVNQGKLALVLTKQRGDFNILSTIKLKASDDIKVVFMEPVQFPRSGIFLESADFVILDDIDLNALPQPSLTALNEWTADGGILILTQRLARLNAANPWLGSFITFDSAKSINITEPAGFSSFFSDQENLVTGLKAIQSTARPEQVSLACEDIPLEPSPELRSAGVYPRPNQRGASPLKGIIPRATIPLVIKREYGLGRVIFTAFDLFSLSYRNPEKADAFLRLAWDKLLSMGTSETWREWNREDTIPKQADIAYLDKWMKIYLLILLIFLGPVNYVVLKRLDKREYILLSIPGVALVFCLGALVTGFSLRSSRPAMDIVRVEMGKANDNHLNVKTLAGVLSSDTGMLTLKTDKAMYPVDKIESSYDEYEKIGRFPVDTYYGDDRAVMSNLQIPLWAMRFFRFDSSAAYDSTLEGQVELKGQNLAGTVTNNLPYTLKNAYLVYRMQHIKLGDIPSGKSLDWTLPIQPPNAQICSLTEEKCDRCGDYHIVSGIFNSRLWDGKSLDKTRLKILEDISGEYLNFFEQPVLIGWADQPTSDIYIDREDRLLNYQRLCLFKLPLFVDDTELNLPYGVAQRTVYNDHYKVSPYYLTVGEDSPLEVEYKLPVSINRPFEISSLKLIMARVVPARQPEEAGAEPPALKFSAYDWTTQKWQEITATKQETLELQIDSPQKFVHLPDGLVKVMVEQTGKARNFNFNVNISFSTAFSMAKSKRALESFLGGNTRLKYLDIAFAGHEKEK